MIREQLVGVARLLNSPPKDFRRDRDFGSSRHRSFGPPLGGSLPSSRAAIFMNGTTTAAHLRVRSTSAVCGSPVEWVGHPPARSSSSPGSSIRLVSSVPTLTGGTRRRRGLHRLNTPRPERPRSGRGGVGQLRACRCSSCRRRHRFQQLPAIRPDAGGAATSGARMRRPISVRRRPAETGLPRVRPPSSAAVSRGSPASTPGR